MKVFITGATGFIGANLATMLADSGARVHALYRTKSKTEGIRHERIRWFRGDLGDRESLLKAMEGCDYACHLGAFASLLIREPDSLYEQNVQGTVNVLECARDMGLKRVVFTSTAGVLGPSPEGRPKNERTPYPEEFHTHYIRSKILAEQKVIEYVRQGMDAVIVNPSRVYGPGVISTSNAAGMLKRYLLGKWHILPGSGKIRGNYVYVDDVSRGILLALEKGKKGERYLLGGENLSFKEFLDTVNRIAGTKKIVVKVPFFAIQAFAGLLLLVARISRWTPPFTPSEIRRFKKDWLVSSEKARKQLGYAPRSFEEGMKITVAWLKKDYTH